MTTEWFKQSFFFDWNKVTDPTPVPITAQCETINISWSRSAATGPDPVAPYFLEIFTSNYIFPFQIPVGSGLSTSLTIPFAPGTQYQICMFDSRGNTGGCQAVYTVYAPPATQSQAGQCANFTMPATVLQVNSSAGQYAWIPSCTDLTLKPESGVAPYQVTIAPALHPPFNISNIGPEGTSWKVQLMWGMPFFVSMTDSSGLTWSYGPLHAGEGSTDCLGSAAKGVSTGALAGGIIGSLIIGALVGFGIMMFFGRRRKSYGSGHISPIEPARQASMHATPYIDPYHDATSQPLMHHQTDYFDSHGRRDTGLQRTTSGNQSMYTNTAPFSPGYQVEPYDPRGSVHGGETSPTFTQAPSEATSSRTKSQQQQQVYVVHHDQGPAPVSIYTAEGTEIVELPPLYTGGGGQPQHSPQPPTPTAAPIEGDRSPPMRPPGAAPPEVMQTLPGRGGRQVGSNTRLPEKGGVSGPRPLPQR